jgi:hypothetical protein
MFITAKKFGGVVDTSEQIIFPQCHRSEKSLKFFTGVNGTADKFLAVSATPAIRESCQY